MAARLADLARMHKALADATRLRILGLLLAGEVCVCHIHESLGISQTKTSRHLAYLRRSGLVDTRRDGVWMHYRLAETADPVLDAVRQAALHAVRHTDALAKDAGRLQRRTGCCLPPLPRAASSPCCAPAAARRDSR